MDKYYTISLNRRVGKAKGLSAHSGFTISSIQGTELEYMGNKGVSRGI